jgi:hypothetical protein
VDPIQLINIQNIYLLNEQQNLDEFYKFLKSLDFLSHTN